MRHHRGSHHIHYRIRPICDQGIRGKQRRLSIEAYHVREHAKALDKYNRLNPVTVRQHISRIDQLVCSSEYLKRILVPFKDRIIPIKTEAIAYFYNTNGESSVVTRERQSYSIGKSLDSLMIKLNPTCFFRVNRQFILSKEVIDSFTIWFDSRLRINLSLPTDEPIFVAKNKAAEFKVWLSSY